MTTAVRVGTDSTKLPGGVSRDAVWIMERVAELGLEGVFFRDMTDLSRTLDPTELRDAMDAASDLQIYVEAGAGKVNPFATPEDPSIRLLGEGDWVAGMRRKLIAAADCGISEVWAATANYQFRLRGLRACDRFRTDAPWPEQLTATAKVLSSLAPTLRDLGLHLNLETHEEITSSEAVRLVEEAGPDAFGITFDTANVIVRGEDPVAAARRVAPYMRQTHLRDVVLIPTDSGIGRFVVPIGEGVIEWAPLLDELALSPCRNYSIEGVFPGMQESPGTEMTLFTDDPEWRASRGGIDVGELAWSAGHAQQYASRASTGDLPDEASLRRIVSEEAASDFIVRSAADLRGRLAVATGALAS